jgi:hypothetical protein
MDFLNTGIKIVPDVTIEDKYSTIIETSLARISTFTENAVDKNRVEEMYDLEKSKMNLEVATKLLQKKGGRLIVGFQFETHPDMGDDNFQVYVKKVTKSGKSFKYLLTPTVQEIMLQLISLEDRRTIAIFSLLNSNPEVSYRILTTLYGNQLRRLSKQVSPLITDVVKAKIEKLKVAKAADDSGIWKSGTETMRPPSANQAVEQRTAQDNILQVMADEATFNEIYQYVSHVEARAERIREKQRRLEANPDVPRNEIYHQMIREDMDQLENCYARIHIYLKAYYKNKDRRALEQNFILRQFFGGEIENIIGETGILEDLLCLLENAYFENIKRHQEIYSQAQ